MRSIHFLSMVLATRAWAGVIDSFQQAAQNTTVQANVTSGIINGGFIDSFIALGESYSAGVGAGVHDKNLWQSRCLRYNESYTRFLADDTSLPGVSGQSRLINNACSGQTIPKILATQFGTEDKSDFHAFGKPQFATISAAGDDIEFKELVINCVYEFPWKTAKCQKQIEKSNGILDDPAFQSSIENLIKTTLTNGQPANKDFRVYYTGYAQFFNVAPTNPDYCSEKTWSLSYNPFTREKLKLDIPLRTQLNGLATKLNTKIQAAVNLFAETDKDEQGVPLVKYVDIDDLIQGHRYCEQGKQEPVNNDNDIWFFQWNDNKFGENTNDLPDLGETNDFYDKVAQSLSIPGASNLTDAETANFQKNLNITLDDFEEHEIDTLTNGYPDNGSANNIEDIILNRVKTFHPKPQFHEMIEQRIRDMVNKDFGSVISQPCGKTCQPFGTVPVGTS